MRRHQAIRKALRVGPQPSNVLEARAKVSLPEFYRMYLACKQSIGNFDAFCQMMNVGPEHNPAKLLALFEKDGKTVQIRMPHKRNLPMYTEGPPIKSGYTRIKVPTAECEKYGLCIATCVIEGTDGQEPSGWVPTARWSAARLIVKGPIPDRWATHHIALDSKTDNRPSNLLVVPLAEHYAAERLKYKLRTDPNNVARQRAYYSLVKRLRAKYFPIDCDAADAEYAEIVSPYGG